MQWDKVTQRCVECTSWRDSWWGSAVWLGGSLLVFSVFMTFSYYMAVYQLGFDWHPFSDGCPIGTQLVGAAPPKGLEIACESAAGVRTGPRKVWFENGQVKTEEYWVSGQLHGLRVEWAADGSLEARTEYYDGEVRSER